MYYCFYYCYYHIRETVSIILSAYYWKYSVLRRLLSASAGGSLANLQLHSKLTLYWKVGSMFKVNLTAPDICLRCL